MKKFQISSLCMKNAISQNLSSHRTQGYSGEQYSKNQNKVKMALTATSSRPQLPIPFDGTESIDFLRAQNLTLKIENNKLEQENMELRHNLQLALTKAGSWGGMKQRVSLNKPQSVVVERLWVGDAASVVNRASFDGAAVMDSLEQQLAELQAQLDQSLHEKQSLASAVDDQRRVIQEQKQELQQLSNVRGDKGTAVAYYQSQISFLHSEVERLENACLSAQDEAIEKIRLAAQEHQHHLAERDKEVVAAKDELNRVRAFAGIHGSSSSGSGRGGGLLRGGKLDGEDMLSRCRMMEVQLASSLAEKNALHVENGDLHAKVRKLEAAARDKKQLLQEMKRTAVNDTTISSEHAQRLSFLLSSTMEEKSKVEAELEEALSKLNVRRVDSLAQTEEDPMVETSIQCDPPVALSDNGCQVDTIGHFADPTTQSAQALRHALETKCGEFDEARLQLDTLASIHKEALQFLDVTKKRLVDEKQRTSDLEGDVERLSLQLRSVQQQVSQLCALDREKDAIVEQAQSQQRDAQLRLIKAEEEYRSVEVDVAKQKKDLNMLVASQNMNHQQVHELNRQNQILHEEIQKLRMALESDKYIIQAKDAELRDVISSYQMAAKEGEVLGSSRDVLERENETLRQVIRSLEERYVMSQEQIGHLHSREQQLSLDLQSFDHELGQLHRRLHTCQTGEAEASAQAQNHLNTIRGLECTCDELRRNLAELSKQVVIRDNESVLLRVRCDSLEKEVASLSAAHRNDSKRVRELEDANAQLVVRGILSQGPSASSTLHQSHYASGAPRSASGAATPVEGGSSVSDVGAADRLRRVERDLAEALAANARLEKVARDQSLALSQISR